jgi:NitT/TauT family transport system substrate-binding protein
MLRDTLFMATRTFSRLMAIAFLALAAARAECAPLEPVSVRLDWLAGIYHAPIYLAKARGYYAQQGLDVTFHNGQGSLSTLQIVGSGNETIGLANLSALTLARAAGVPVVAIGALMEKSP